MLAKAFLEIELCWAAKWRVQPGWRSSRHRHRWWQCIHVTDGALTVALGEELRVLKRRQALLIRPGVQHRLLADHAAEAYDVKFVAPNAPETILCNACERQNVTAPQMPATFTALFERLVDEGRASRPHYREMAALVLAELLLLLMRGSAAGEPGALPQAPPHTLPHSQPVPAARSSTVPSTVDSIVRYIKEHFDEEISLPRLALRFGYHPTYLCQLFSDAVGVPPMRYVAECRLDRAQALLSSSRFTIAHISELVGYKSVKQFSRAFRDAKGASPSEYRRRRSARVEAEFLAHWEQIDRSEKANFSADGMSAVPTRW